MRVPLNTLELVFVGGHLSDCGIPMTFAANSQCSCAQRINMSPWLLCPNACARSPWDLKVRKAGSPSTRMIHHISVGPPTKVRLVVSRPRCGDGTKASITKWSATPILRTSMTLFGCWRVPEVGRVRSWVVGSRYRLSFGVIPEQTMTCHATVVHLDKFSVVTGHTLEVIRLKSGLINQPEVA